MKITIEDTTDFHEKLIAKFTYELDFDDVRIDDMIEAFRIVLYARGFSHETINEALGKPE